MTPPVGAARAGMLGPADAIPDSGLLHNYDWSNDATTTSTVPDLAGGTNLTGGFTNLSAAINGRQAGTFDGTDDEVRGDYANVTEPYDIFFVARFRSINSNDITFESTSGGQHQLFIDSGPAWGLFQGSIVSGGTPDTNAHLFTTGWSTTDILRIDEADVASGDSGTAETSGMIVGSAGGSNFAPVDAGQLAVYDADASGYSRSDVEVFLVDKWGPF